MATTFTALAKFKKPAFGDTAWDVAVNANTDQIDACAAVGPLSVTLHETPSTTLNVAVGAGTYVKSDGSFVTYAGSTSFAVTTAATNYLYLLDSTGVLTASTSAFPAASHVRLAVVVAGATTITSITDARIVWGSRGANTATKTAKVALAAVDSAGGLFSWVNPEGAAIIITRLIIDVTTVASAAHTIDAGTTVVSGATLSDNMVDGLDGHSAVITADQFTTPGANGKALQRLASGGWVTGSTASGASAGIVGAAYISYILA